MYKRYLLSFILLLAFTCGCIGGEGDVFEGDISELLVNIDDLPSGYAIEIDKDTLIGDMPDTLLEKGFSEGKVRYFTLSNAELKASFGQTVQRYEPETISGVLDYAKTNMLESEDIEEIAGRSFGEGSFILHSTQANNESYVIMFFDKDIIVQVFHNGILLEPDLVMLESIASEINELI